MSLQIVCRDLQEAVACLRGGHALIFPTEHFMVSAAWLPMPLP